MTFGLKSCQPGRPGAFEWALFVIVLLVQQNAFISLPILIQDVPLTEMREFDNPATRPAVALSLLVIGGLCLSHIRALVGAARANIATLLFTVLVVLSTMWSIHPDITGRRAIGYVLTMLVAALLPLRFGVDGLMKVLSLSFAVSAIGSVAFVLIAPQYGIMHEEELTGAWQGVFCTKQLLGSVMAVAVFVEAYILTKSAGKPRWRFGLLAVYCALVVLSRSTTALLTTWVYLAGAGVFVLWKRHRSVGLFAVVTVLAVLSAAAAVFLLEPDVVFSTLGKDPTLTGRTRIWWAVTELVCERPILGWGYKAMWQSSDSFTAYVDGIAGFKVPSSHNAFLEIALQLGVAGVALMSLSIIVALRRSIRCMIADSDPLGWFSVMFIAGALMAGLTTETLGQSQVIEWVVFNALTFRCGMCCRELRAGTRVSKLVGDAADPVSQRIGARKLQHCFGSPGRISPGLTVGKVPLPGQRSQWPVFSTSVPRAAE